MHDILTKPVRGEQLLSSLPAMKLGPGQSHQVMMVDDDRGALKLADRMLRQRGYEAVCHSTAKAALRAARQRVPAAVILDLNMPELDGFQFLEQFRRQSDTRRIPVIVWSAMELTARQRKHLHASAQAVVSKSRGTGTLIDELTAHAPLPAAREESPGRVERQAAAPHPLTPGRQSAPVRGSSMSRRPSPSRFTPSTARSRASPGKTAAHGAVRRSD